MHKSFFSYLIWSQIGLLFFLLVFSGCGGYQASGTGSRPPGVGESAAVFTPYPPMPTLGDHLSNSSGKTFIQSKDSQSTTLSANWSTISFPFDNLISTTGSDYYLQSWDGTSYHQVDINTHPSSVDCGQGYWAYTVKSCNLLVNGDYNSNLNSVTLNSGWNLVAFPRRANKTFGYLTLAYQGQTKTLANSATLNTVQGSAWIYGVIQYYRNNRWYNLNTDNPGNALNPWKGYWIFSWVNGVNLYFDQPFINGLNPSTGIAGDTVTITGFNFSTSGSVTFNGAPSQVVSCTDGKILCLVPAGAIQGDVVVTANGLSSPGVNFTARPQISSLNPSSGILGDTVTLNGSGFGNSQGGATASINGTNLQILSWSNIAVVGKVAPGTTGGEVLVNTSRGASNRNLTFTVLPHIGSVSPVAGNPGTLVTIGGTSFGSSASGNSVTFNSLSAQIVGWSDTQITCQAPAGNCAGPVLVTVGGLSSNGDFAFTLFPYINEVSPVSGIIGGTITINGSNFGAAQGAGSVTLGGAALTGLTWSDSQITCRIPEGAVTGNLQVTNAIGSSNSDVLFTVVPHITGLNPVTGPVGTTVTISGTGFAGLGTISFNGVFGTPISWNSTQILCQVPSGAATGAVVVANTFGTSNSDQIFAVVQNLPTIDSLNPNAALAGASVTINGSNFGDTQDGGSTVSFNGTNAVCTSWSATQIVCTVPALATNGNVVVTVNGIASNPINFTVKVPIAGNYYVNAATGSDTNGGSPGLPFKTVKKALSMATSGQIICVAAGTYDPTNGETFPLTVPSGVKLRGGFNNDFTAQDPAANITTLDANQTNRVVSLGAGSAELNGFVVKNGRITSGNGAGISCSGPDLITNCNVTNNSAVGAPAMNGGGVYISGSNVTVSSCLINSNSVNASTGNPYGGGIYGTSCTITGCTISNNSVYSSSGSAAAGGGIYGGSASSITNCTISGNTAGSSSSFTNGGGAYFNGTVSNFSNNIVSNNSVTYPANSNAGGGGIYLSNPITTFNNNVVSGNTASSTGTGTVYGGGIYYNGSGAFTITNSVLSGNSVSSGASAIGGGMYLSSSGPLTLTNTVMAGNSAGTGSTGNGGGICFSSSATLNLNNCLFYGNHAKQGGGVYFPGTPTMTIVNTIFNANTATTNGGGIYVSSTSGTVAVTYSDFQGNTPYDVYRSGSNGGISNFSGWSWNGTGCFSTDPLLLNPASGDYHLQDTSPCLNTGNPAYSGVLNQGSWATQAGYPDTDVVDLGYHYSSWIVSPAPVITGLSSTSGPIGFTVTINGSNFSANQGTSSITFNGIDAGQALSWSSNSIVCAVPYGAANGPVVVSSGGYTSNNNKIFQVLTSISLSPDSVTLHLTQTRQFTVTAYDTDSAALDVTSRISIWDCDNAAAGSINSSGLFTAVSSGSDNQNARITAVLGSLTSHSAEVSVIMSYLPIISDLSPANAATGSTVTINGSHFGLEQGDSAISFNGIACAQIISWGDNQIVCVVPDGNTNGAVVVTIYDEAGGSNVSSNNNINFQLLTSLSITPASSNKKAGQTQQFTATANGSINVTSRAVWNCDNPAAGSISSSGLFTASSNVGQTANITATLDTLTSNQAVVTVTAADYFVNAATGSDTSPGDGSLQHPYQTIAKAISVASAGKIIAVAQGDYPISATLTITSGLKLYGGYRSDFLVCDPVSYPTNLNGNINGGNGMVSFSGANNTTEFTGFLLQKGTGTQRGLYLSSSSPQISNCVIKNFTNTTNNGGGGIYCISTSNPAISNCLITGNTTTSTYGGGGIWCSSSSSPTLTNCTISGNTATNSGSNQGGGGIYCESTSNITLTNCLITGNTATGTSGHGGGICCNNASPVITNCLITGNTANGSNNGGGIYCMNTSNPKITNCTFSGNTAANGGGLYRNAGTPIITNCIFSGNTATTSGGGIYSAAGGLNITYTDCPDSYAGGLVFPPAGANCSTTAVTFVDGSPYDYHLFNAPGCIDMGISTGNGSNGAYLTNDSWETQTGIPDTGIIDLGYHYPLTLNPTPIVSGLSPASSPVSSTITINGIGFGVNQGASSVTFNGVDAGQALSWNIYQIVCAVPFGATNGPVVVSSSGYTSNNDQIFRVLTSISLSPVSVTRHLTQTWQFTATAYDTASAALDVTGLISIWDCDNAAAGSINSSGLFTAVSSGGSNQNAHITAVLGELTSNSVEVTVIMSYAPAISGLSPDNAATGSTVTINGSHFGLSQGDSAISFNGIACAQIISWGDNQIVCLVPNGDTNGSVSVTIFDPLVGGNVSSDNNVNFQLLTSLSVTPASINVYPGLTQQFTATANGSINVTSRVIWHCDNASAGSISASGLFTATGTLGQSANITATLDTLTSNQAVITAPIANYFVNAATGSDTSPGNGTLLHPYKTVTKALSMATASNQIICVAGGTYNAAGGEVFPLSVSASGTKLWGGYNSDFSAYDPAANQTILDANQANRVMNLTASGSPDVNGFVIKNGKITSGQGAGINITSGATPFITNCTITYNSVVGTIPQTYGGGIYTTVSGTTISSCLISHNSISSSGNPYGGGIYASTTNVTITGCTISNNSVIGTSGGAVSGGGIYTTGSGHIITNCTISGNTASNASGGQANAGGISMGSVSNFSNNIVSGNSATYSCSYSVSGGGISMGTVDNFSNNIVSGNSITCTSTGSISGGGVYFSVIGALTIANSVFSGNSVNANSGTGNGGGVCLASNVNYTLKNCLFYGNHAKQGGGIYFASPTAITIVNTIFNANTATGNGGGIYVSSTSGTVAVTYSDFQGNTPYDVNQGGSNGGVANFSGWGWNGTGCFSTDPLLLNPAAGDYHLQDFSPCLNTGNPSYSGVLNQGSWATQTNCPDTGVVDLGYHYPWNPVPVVSSLSPASGPVSNTVTITGINFGASQGTSSITFNGINAGQALSWNSNSIVCTVPYGAANGPVVISAYGYTSNNDKLFQVLTSIFLSPASVTCHLEQTQQFIATAYDTAAVALDVTSRISIWNCDNAAAGSINSSGLFTAVSSGSYTQNANITAGLGSLTSHSAEVTVIMSYLPIISDLSPAFGLTGSMVTINGSNFGDSQGESIVSFNGTAATCSFWSATQILCTVPAGATNGGVTVTVGGAISNAVTFSLTPLVRTWGGTSDDEGKGLGVDSAGNIYLAGTTQSFASQGTDMWGENYQKVFLLKYNSAGVIQWQKTWGGAQDDNCIGLALDSAGYIYLTGTTSSFGSGGDDAFILKYSSSGVLQMQKTWGSASSDHPTGIAVDSSGNIYVSGSTNSFGGNHAFAVKFNSSGVAQWQKTWGGGNTYADMGSGIAVDSSGNVYLTGETYNFGAGVNDAFLVKYNSSGVIQWQTTWGGTNSDSGGFVAVDSAGNVYLTGNTNSYASGDYDVFLLKYNSSGVVQWQKTWGGSMAEAVKAIALDSSGNIYLTGMTYLLGGEDAFLLKYNNSGVLQAQKIWGGDGFDLTNGIALDSGGGVYLAGLTSTSDSTALWQNATGVQSTPSGISGTPSGNLPDITGTVGTPAGTSTTPGGSETYAGGNDCLLLETTP